MLGLALMAGRAGADSNDLTLERLLGPPSSPGAVVEPDAAMRSQYLSLMSELGVALAPSVLAPADTLGYSGFQFSLDTSFTSISSGADYWQNGVERVSSNFLSTVSLWVRKGLWLPLPSFEAGAGASKLVGSSLLCLQAYGKLALHEGFHGWPLPSVAVRGAVSRPLASNQVDLTVVSADLSLSKSFGLMGTLQLDPYLGASALFILSRGQIIDTTPDVDAYRQGPNGPDLNSNASFPDENILRWRLFAGFRAVYTIFALSGEFAYTLCRCGESVPGQARDRSSGQVQLSFSASLIF